VATIIHERIGSGRFQVALECTCASRHLRADHAISILALTGRTTRTSERILKNQLVLSRRHHRRIETPQGVCTIWRCGRTEDTSRVKDLSVGGLFIETKKICPVGATVELHFLVEDGEIRANATVRYVKPGSGLGLQFKSVHGEDHVRFATMVKRLLEPG
jgi:hypothetical protein